VRSARRPTTNGFRLRRVSRFVSQLKPARDVKQSSEIELTPKKDEDLSVTEYNPKYRASSPGGISSEKTVRLNDWTGPYVRPTMKENKLQNRDEVSYKRQDSRHTEESRHPVHLPRAPETSDALTSQHQPNASVDRQTDHPTEQSD
jgi:hypothetical protein